MDLYFGSIKLRAMNPDDTQFLAQLLNNPEIEKMVVGKSYSVSECEESNWISNFHNSNTCLRWIIEHHDNTRIGTMIINNIDWINRSAELGIKIDVNNVKRIHGDAKDAYYASILYLFHELNMEKVTAATLEYNAPSIKLHDIMGFKQEGILRRAVYKSGEYHDVILFGLLKSEFETYPDGSAPWQINH